jgi:hypothetical protein
MYLEECECCQAGLTETFETLFQAKTLEEIDTFLLGFEQSNKMNYEPLRKRVDQRNSLDNKFRDEFLASTPDNEEQKQELYKKYFHAIFVGISYYNMFSNARPFNESISG